MPTVPTLKPESRGNVEQVSNGTGQPQYDSFPLRACTQADIAETRYHIMKFHSVKKLDPVKDFEQPSRLHRKDPKNLQFQMSLKEVEQKRAKEREQEADREQRRQEYLAQVDQNGGDEMNLKIYKEELARSGLPPEVQVVRLEEKQQEWAEEKRRLDRENELKLIAPDGGARRYHRRFGRRKTRQIRAYDEKKRKLRYEEYYPWVLEDYDAKQAWVGNYEAGNTDNYCLLVLDNKNKCFKLMPLEKFYRFTPRNKYATLTLEEAEAKMAEGSTGQRWLMKKMAEEAASGQRLDNRYRKIKTTSTTPHEETEDQKRDDEEDMDYDDEFQDDEEAPIMEGNEEENKMVEGKMKKEMLRANNLIEHDAAGDDDDLDDLFETRKVDKQGRKLRKALAQNALNEVYDSDDEENPYLSESEIEDAEKDDDEDQVITIKKEPGADGSIVEETIIKRTEDEPQVSVKSYNNGVVVLKATRKILSQFPAGDWNPRASKRKHSVGNEHPASKKSKKAASPVNEYEITKKDVDDLLKNGSIPLTTLVKELRPKMSKDPNGRANLKQVLKQNFDLDRRQKIVHRRS